MFLLESLVASIILGVCIIVIFRYVRTHIVPEDNVAVTVGGNGFIKRLLPAGRHVLYPFEQIAFFLEIKPRLIANRASSIATRDGILMNLNWSGVYALQPDLITEKLSQRLRGLPTADKAIARNVDIALRGLVGDYTVQDLFKPTVRERIERQLSQLVAGRLKPLGIVLASLHLQAIELPAEVVEALNKAKAIETLDGAIRQLDPTTREVVRGVYQLDEILHWDAYLPIPSRRTMKRLEAMNR